MDELRSLIDQAIATATARESALLADDGLDHETIEDELLDLDTAKQYLQLAKEALGKTQAVREAHEVLAAESLATT